MKPVIVLFALASAAFAQQTPSASPPADSGTSTDLYNLGIGHTFAFLKKDPLGDELTVAYTYENAGSHGFLHTGFGEHTESAGLMKNLALPGTKLITGHTWLQTGITTYTGNPRVENRLDSGASLGAIVPIDDHNSIRIQESYNKVATAPWYTTTSIGYTWSW